MRHGVIIPLIDLAFLSLAAIVAILSQAQLIDAIRVDVTRVAPGAATAMHEPIPVVTITAGGLFVGVRPVSLDEVAAAVDGPQALLRVDRGVPTETLVRVMAELAKRRVEIRIEVRRDGSAVTGGPA